MAETRSRNASRGGKSGGRGRASGAEIRDLKTELGQLKDDVLAGSVDRNDAAVVVQIVRALRDLIELERRVRTTGELAEEIRLLKERLDCGQRQAQ